MIAGPRSVLDRMAASCVPALCDDCTVDLIDEDGTAQRIVHPPRASVTGGLRTIADRAGASSRHRVSVPFGHDDAVLAPTLSEHERLRAGVVGVATFVWRHRVPMIHERTQVVALVALAMQTVSRERSDRAAAGTVAAVDNLRLALQTSRRIGAAVGIVMGQYKVTEDAAFDLLRQASHDRDRKVHLVAVEVMQTGSLDLTPRGAAARPDSHAWAVAPRT